MTHGKMSKQEIEDIAKDICWAAGGGIKCELDCAKCKAGHYKKWKWLVPVVAKSLERIRK